MSVKNIPKVFLNLFQFNQDRQFFIGCEREFFVANEKGVIGPWAKKVLDVLPTNIFGYELSACQAEAHIGPIVFDEFMSELIRINQIIKSGLEPIGFQALFNTIGPDDIPLDVFPDPTGRYQRITKNMPREILKAACIITGTHIHVGMPDHETALKVYNYVVDHVHELCNMADLNNGKRMDIYRIMANDFIPKHYTDWTDLYEQYLQLGYDKDPRKCWTLIRISVHGTIEFRMFDNTSDIVQINSWAENCLRICREAIS
jgi:gamma-glutamyl:cysteine ligase YbdK (ATP-grasp superfamily)